MITQNPFRFLLELFSEVLAGKPVSLRLQGPLSANDTGRVEVSFYGQWGTICNYEWHIKDAKVVCRQLGYQDAVRTLQSHQVSSGSGRIWLSNVRCTGGEQNINNNSRHSADIGVECSSEGESVSDTFVVTNFNFLPFSFF